MLRRAVPLLLSLVVLAACTGEEAADPGLKVGGAFGVRPTVVFPEGRPSAGLRIDQLAAGRGEPLRSGDLAIAHYTAHVWDGRENRLVDSSFTRGAPVAFPVGRLLPGLDKALLGRRVGSRVIAAIPPGEGFGANPPQGIAPGDDLVYVIDILGAHPEGASVKARGGSLAGVRAGGGTRPRLSVPESAPPARFAAKVLSKGKGPRARTGQLLVLQYQGAVWERRRVFDSTWSTGLPKAFTIGDGSVIKGWDRALAGVRVGSRVLMVVPPAQGYGPSGQPAFGIGPDDTLVFLVDVLAAY